MKDYRRGDSKGSHTAERGGPTTIGGYPVRRPTRGSFPGPDLARVVEQRWRVVAGQVPLPPVVGDVWIDADPLKSPWVDPAALSREGAVLIWEASAGPPEWLERFPAARRQTDIELAYVPSVGHAPARLGWAILPPA